ncbi:MAG: metallophosphoesterase [Candidatus Kariarchaeaceae archaeon]
MPFLEIIPPETEKNFDKLLRLAHKVVETLKNCPNVVDLPSGKTLFVGDLHGDLESAKKAVKIANENKVDHIVFMGDYTDRGLHQLETLEFIFKLILLDPKRIITLRGNHESKKVNEKYGFIEVVEKAFSKEEAKKILEVIFQTYEYFPLVATTPFSIALHGGIPQYASLEDIRLIPKPHSLITSFDDEKKVFLNRVWIEVQWNDPSESMEEPFGPSFRGKTPKTFSKKPLIQFLKGAGKNRLFRSHEASRGPYALLWENQLIYIFSSAPYPPNKPRIHEAAYALEEKDGSIKIISDSFKIIVELEPIIIP